MPWPCVILLQGRSKVYSPEANFPRKSYFCLRTISAEVTVSHIWRNFKQKNMESRGRGGTSWIFKEKKKKKNISHIFLSEKKSLKKEKKLNLLWKLSHQKASVPLKHPQCFSMGVCYPSSLVLMLIAPIVGQDLWLPSAALKQNKRIVSAARSLNPTLLIFLSILGPVTDFVTWVLSACCHWEVSAAGRLSFTMLY